MKRSIPGPENTVGERIEWARVRAGIGKGELAEALGTHPSRVSNWTSARNAAIPNAAFTRGLAQELGVEAYWIQTGLGSAEPEETPPLERRVVQLEAIVRKLARVIADHGKIPENEKATLLRLAIDTGPAGDDDEALSDRPLEIEMEAERVRAQRDTAAAVKPSPQRQGRAS